MKQLLDLCVNTMEHAQNRKMNGTRYDTCYVPCQFICEFRSFQSCLRHWLILPYAIEQQESLNLSKSLHCCRFYILGLKYENIFGIMWPQKPCLNGIWIKVTELFMDGIKLGISSTDKKTFIFISDRTI